MWTAVCLLSHHTSSFLLQARRMYTSIALIDVAPLQAYGLCEQVLPKALERSASARCQMVRQRMNGQRGQRAALAVRLPSSTAQQTLLRSAIRASQQQRPCLQAPYYLQQRSFQPVSRSRSHQRLLWQRAHVASVRRLLRCSEVFLARHQRCQYPIHVSNGHIPWLIGYLSCVPLEIDCWPWSQHSRPIDRGTSAHQMGCRSLTACVLLLCFRSGRCLAGGSANQLGDPAHLHRSPGLARSHSSL